MEEKILNFRIKAGFTQDFVAEKLGLSRQSYILTEKGERKLAVDELKKLSSLYGVPITEFFFEPRKLEKFTQMYFYILSHFERGVPKTKLAKLLYLSDFYHFYNNLEPMSGVPYLRKQYGPLADVFLEMTDELYESGKINIDYLSRGAEIISLKDPNEKSIITSSSSISDYSLLSPIEKQEIDEICDFWKNRRTAEIVNFTHEQKPWMSCRDGEVIPYSLIIQEEPDHVYSFST